MMSLSILAQSPEGRKEKIRTYKIAYLTDQLDLSQEEAEKFWPIYNAHDKKMMQIRRNKHRNTMHSIKEKGGAEAYDQSEATNVLNELMAYDTEMQTTRQQLYKELKNVLSPNKLLKLYIAESNFNKKLLNEYKRRQPK